MNWLLIIFKKPIKTIPPTAAQLENKSIKTHDRIMGHISFMQKT